jgi:hypothetical protein
MSFTADEIQTLNEILDRKLGSQRREFEHVLDQRMQTLRRDMELRLGAAQQEIIATLAQRLSEQHKRTLAQLGQQSTFQQRDVVQAFNFELELQQKHLQPRLESMFERALAAQLLAFEELLDQRDGRRVEDEYAGDGQDGERRERPTQCEAIEVQTELPWEDLSDIFGRVLDDRFAALNHSTQERIRSWEQYLSMQLRILQSDMHDEIAHVSRQPQTYSGSLTSVQEVFQSLEQLERLIESLQVAMTANHAMLSNRLYHHQQLPLERAHGGHVYSPPQQQPPPSPPSPGAVTHPNGAGNAGGPRTESNVS